MRALFGEKRSDDASLPALPRADTEAKAKDPLEILWRGKWFIVLSVFVSVGMCFVYVKRATPQYTSTAQIFVEPSNAKIMGAAEASSQTANYIPTQLEVIKSPSVVQIAMESGTFHGMKTFAGLDNPLGAIKGSLEAEVGRNNDIINVSFTGPYPDESADIVNRLVEGYKTYHARQKRSSSGEVMKILQQERDTREAELQKKLQEKLQFMQDNSTLVFQSDGTGGYRASSPALQRIDELTQALTAAQLVTAQAKANFELAKSAQNDPEKLRSLMRAQSDAQIEAQLQIQLRLQLMQIDQQIEDYRGIYGAGSPTLRELNARRSQMKAQIATLTSSPSASDPADPRLGSAYVESTEQKYLVAQSKEQELEALLNRSLPEQRKETVDAARYATLESDYRRIEKLCDDLQNRMGEVHVTEDSGALNVTVLEWGKPPASPSKPKSVQLLLVALLLGLTVGVSMAYVAVWSDQRFKSAEEVQAVLDLPVLGAVPVFDSNTTLPERGRTVELDPSSDVSEAYRTIRTAIYFGLPDTRQKTLLITSPQPGDGKSTSASNLAIAMAKAGRRTLLIDADFRLPSLHKIYGPSPSIGFAGVLQGKGVISDAIQPTGIANFDFLPCGPIPQNPAELLHSEMFVEVLTELSEQYVHIVIDSSPVLPVTDARILAAGCDSTLLVLRAEKSTHKTARHARDLLQSTGARIAGVLVNGAAKKGGVYGDGYYYGYGYGAQSSNGNGNGNGHGSGSDRGDAAVRALTPPSPPLLDTNVEVIAKDRPQE